MMYRGPLPSTQTEMGCYPEGRSQHQVPLHIETHCTSVGFDALRAVAAMAMQLIAGLTSSLQSHDIAMQSSSLADYDREGVRSKQWAKIAALRDWRYPCILGAR